MHPNDITSIRSEAIREFCEKAKIMASAYAQGLPEDVRRYRAHSAFTAKQRGKKLRVKKQWVVPVLEIIEMANTRGFPGCDVTKFISGPESASYECSTGS